MIFSACGFNLFSMIFSMTLLGYWWSLLFGSPGTAAGCLSWEMWWLKTGSTVLAILQSARSYCRLLWEWRLHPLHLPGLVLMGWCRLQLTSLSSMIVLQPPLLCKCRPLCVSGDTSVLMNLHWSCDCTAQSSILSIGSVSVFLLWGFFVCFVFVFVFLWTILDSGSFSLFNGGQFFHELVCPLIVILPQIFFSLTALLFYPDFFCPFHAPADVVVHFFVLLNSFRFESLLSQFSPLVAQIKNFCSDPVFLLLLFLTIFAKDLAGCFSHCCVEGGTNCIHVHIQAIHSSRNPLLVVKLTKEPNVYTDDIKTRMIENQLKYNNDKKEAFFFFFSPPFLLPWIVPPFPFLIRPLSALTIFFSVSARNFRFMLDSKLSVQQTNKKDAIQICQTA